MEPLQVADLTSPDVVAPAAPLIKEKIPAASDTDTATKQTVGKMCEYRRTAGSDPVVKRWAENAHRVFGLNSNDPRAKAWGAFWQVKHSVKFASDEPRLFQVGEPAALDLLIAPAVLVRQPEPKGDCDDFTMLLQTLLDQLGIESYTVTVASDPQDPSRWSHVFCVAKLPDGTLCAMDASHGDYPGWMVPREHIYRWQGWDSAGNAVNLPMPEKHGLHGYIPTGQRRGMRGLGQCVDPESGETVDCGSTGSTPLPDLPIQPINVGTIPNQTYPSTTTSTSTSTPTNWAAIISATLAGATKAIQTATVPAGYALNANGQLVYTGQAAASAQLTSSIASLLPIALLAFVAVAVFGDVSGGRR